MGMAAARSDGVVERAAAWVEDEAAAAAAAVWRGRREGSAARDPADGERAAARARRGRECAGGVGVGRAAVAAARVVVVERANSAKLRTTSFVCSRDTVAEVWASFPTSFPCVGSRASKLPSHAEC